MTSEWAKFWLSIGVMVLGAGLFANLAWSQPLEVGSLSQWASAAATTAAIWVALHNAQIANRESDRRDRLRQEIADRSYVESVRSLAKRASTLFGVIEEHLSNEVKAIGHIRAMAKVYDDRDIYENLKRIPLHSAPDPRLITIISDLLLAVKNVRLEIEAAVEEGVDAQLLIGSEIKLANGALARLEKHFPSRASPA
ncbi:MAG: hypothetical protein SWI22_11235 [Pseudomonadota bacterium]|nr:hypothetical protein [Pseudomonadota bacterium]